MENDDVVNTITIEDDSYTDETIDETIDTVFNKLLPQLEHELSTPGSNIDDDTTSTGTGPHTLDRIYPESLLQLEGINNANRYIASFQRHQRQFIDSSEQSKVLRWRNSPIESLEGLIIEQSFLGNTPLVSSSDNGNSRRKSYLRPATGALFSWSSNETYIEARKQELMRRGRKVSGNLDNGLTVQPLNQPIEESDKKPETLIDRVGLNLPKESTMTKLNQLIDHESNKFIHDRIQVIKAHHSEQISQKINERKRRDHELHLHRLKLKEEQYERELKAATEEKEKSNRFLGIFNFSTSDNSTVMDSTDKIDKTNTDKPRVNKSDSLNSMSLDLKKRFSFLPKTNIFGSSKDDNSQKNIVVNEDNKPEESSSKAPEDSIPEELSSKDSMPQEPLKVNSQDLDLVFKVPDELLNNNNNNSNPNDLDEFEEFQSSPSPQPPKKEEKIITGHRFLPMSEPTPLINLDNDESINTSNSNVSNDNKTSTNNNDQDLLIL